MKESQKNEQELLLTDSTKNFVRIYRKSGKRCQYARGLQVTETTILDSDKDSVGKRMNGYICRRVLDPGDWIIDNWKSVYGCSAQAFKALGWCFDYEEAVGHPRNPNSSSARRLRKALENAK